MASGCSKIIVIEFNEPFQSIKCKIELVNPDLICILVRLLPNGKDEFYVFQLRYLQEIIFNDYRQNLEKHKGERPGNNKKSSHTAVNPKHLEGFRDKWDLLINQFL